MGTHNPASTVTTSITTSPSRRSGTAARLSVSPATVATAQKTGDTLMDETSAGPADFAAELARRRALAGRSLADVAAAAHVARGYVHNVEHGRRWPSAAVARALDTALEANGALLAVWTRSQRLTSEPPARRPRSPVTFEPPSQVFPHAGTVADVETVRAMADAFQAADRQVGGGRLYPALLRFLRVELAPALVDPRGDGSASMFEAAASMTEIAGWMAHDGGDDSAAHSHLTRAYRLATAAASNTLAGNVCASMAHLATQLGRGDDAVRIAEVGLERATSAEGTAWLVARLHAMRAHGYSLNLQTADANAALDTAETALVAAAGTEHAEWIARFDEGALASERALCLLGLGDLAGAEAAARRVIELRDGDRVRSRAFGQLTLARVLVRAGRPDEAATVGAEVCEVAPSLTSERVRSRLAGLGAELLPHRAVAGVGSFLERLAAVPTDISTNGEPQWPV